MWEDNRTPEDIQKSTGITKSGLHKIISKAKEAG